MIYSNLILVFYLAKFLYTKSSLVNYMVQLVSILHDSSFSRTMSFYHNKNLIQIIKVLCIHTPLPLLNLFFVAPKSASHFLYFSFLLLLFINILQNSPIKSLLSLFFKKGKSDFYGCKFTATIAISVFILFSYLYIIS